MLAPDAPAKPPRPVTNPVRVEFAADAGLARVGRNAIEASRRSKQEQ